MNDSQKKLVIGVAAVMVIVVIVGFIIYSSKGASPCPVVEEIPKKLEGTDFKEVASSDTKTLAKFDGFIEIKELDDKGNDKADAKSKYCALPLTAVLPTGNVIALTTNCGNVKIEYKKQDKEITFEKITIEELNVANVDSKTCEATASQLIVKPIPNEKKLHYKCVEEKSSPCKFESKKVKATLHFRQIEFETEVTDKKFSDVVTVC